MQPERKSRSRRGWRIPPRLGRWWVALQMVLGIALGIVFFDRLLMPFVVRWGGDETVPQLHGAALEEGRRRLHAKNLEVGEVMDVIDHEVPAGRIVTQDPKAGARVREGRRVRLVVSLGPPVRAVPELAGQTVRSATIALAQLDLRPGGVLAVPAAAPKGLILGTRPPQGDSPGRDGKVDFLVSAGPRRLTYLVPDLRGLRVSEARAMVRETGIHLIFEGTSDWVMSQDPRPGAPIRTGEAIRVG